MEGRRTLVNRKTTSLIDESEGFYGRDADKEAIIDMLISDDDDGSNPGVIPIVGMGGVGKTTLAQHVYNDKAVEEHFKIRAWVCVSDQFDEAKVTKEMLEKVTETMAPFGDLDQLQRKLKGALDGKKFLLVLDDVWSEEYEIWRQLLTPLSSGAKGSKLIITTRNKEVASKVQTVPTHDLRVLDYEDCWKLFARHACLDVNFAANPPELQEIGKKIVRKCGGLPLATKALGGALRWQTKAEKWKAVLKSEIWDVPNANILPALAMSYIHLPSHLKRCFAYCAIFPQDYEFRMEKLVALWISEGFLVHRKGNQSLEETGDRYFDDLVSRSFFQYSRDSWEGPCFVMHDLVHDLARFVSGEFCSSLEGGTSQKFGERTRHLFYKSTLYDIRKTFQGIHETPFLRSFVLIDEYECERINSMSFNEEIIDGFISTRKLLRVLSLSCREMIELPNSIRNLKYMRHLDLSKTSIIWLPNAVTALFNLEILILQDCRRLEWLPNDMARLINLCQLDLRGTRLERMPPEMGKLKKLNKLTDFFLERSDPFWGYKGTGSSIKELGHLHCLRGEISIWRLQELKDDRDASEANLKDKENLKTLRLSWDYPRDSRRAKQVLDRLQPHTQIEFIEIQNYGGTEFPNWVGDIPFSKLRTLRLKGCKMCICLPPLGQLAALEELSIDGDGNAVLEAIGLEFYGMCKPREKPFSSLKRLYFDNMMNWREWSSFNGAFPVLEELELSWCPKLLFVADHLPSIKRLRIKSCRKLDIESLLISTCATLETIEIQGSEKVKYISLETFPNLKKLEIRDLSNLESLASAAIRDPLFCPSLTSLTIIQCYKLTSFPSGGLRAPNLKDMGLFNCRNLKLLPQGMHSLLPSLENLRISVCPEIESFPEGGLPSKLRSLEINKSEKLVGGRMQWGLQSLRSLSSVSIEGVSREDVESSFPEETLLPSSLQSLEIRHFAKMNSLNYKGLQHLTSLQHLEIKYCENLGSLPEEGLPASLSSLNIFSCPLLIKRCKREMGEDWPKIKHIPHFYID